MVTLLRESFGAFPGALGLQRGSHCRSSPFRGNMTGCDQPNLCQSARLIDGVALVRRIIPSTASSASVLHACEQQRHELTLDMFLCSIMARGEKLHSRQTTAHLQPRPSW